MYNRTEPKGGSTLKVTGVNASLWYGVYKIMAIVVEEERKRINWVFIFSVLIILFALGATVFYIFFINPEQVEVFISPQLKSLTQFEKINFTPNDLLNNSKFKELKNYIEFVLPSKESIGKSNPFFQ